MASPRRRHAVSGVNESRISVDLGEEEQGSNDACKVLGAEQPRVVRRQLAREARAAVVCQTWDFILCVLKEAPGEL